MSTRQKLAVSLMVVALVVSVQAGTMTKVETVKDLKLVNVVAAINSGSHGPALDSAGKPRIENPTTKMEGVTFVNDMAGKTSQDNHNDDLYNYPQQVKKGLAADGQKFVGPGGSAKPIDYFATVSRLYCSEMYGGSGSSSAPSAISKSIPIANGTYTVQILVQQRGGWTAFAKLIEMFSIEGQDSDLYDIRAMNAAAGNIEKIDGKPKGYFLSGWVYTDTVTVKDGKLDIEVTSIGGYVKYNAIIVTRH